MFQGYGCNPPEVERGRETQREHERGTKIVRYTHTHRLRECVRMAREREPFPLLKWECFSFFMCRL